MDASRRAIADGPPQAPPRAAASPPVHDRYRVLLEHAAVGLARVGLDGRFVEVNRRFAEIAGHPVDTLLGLGFQAITDPDDLELDLRHLEDLRAGRIEHYAIDKRYRRADGHAVWVHLTVGRVRDATGAPVEFVSAITDIDARRSAEARLKRSETMLAQGVRVAGLGVFEHDFSTGQVACSPVLATILGLEPNATLTPEAYLRGVHPDDRCSVAEAIAIARDPAGEGIGTSDHRWVHPDGSVRWLQLRSKTAFDGEGANRRPTRTVGAIRDVTREHEVDARKEEFLATLAHELRNPLAPLVTAARVIARLDALPESGRRALSMIERQARHMTRLVDDLLEVTRVTQGLIMLRPEPVRVDEAIAGAVEAMAPAFEARGQRVSIEVPDPSACVHADPVRLTQILENLLNNACEYTPEGGAVSVGAGAVDADIEIRVTDTGIGLAPDQLGRVFELFVQAEPGIGERQGGLGIGLAMVRRLAELHAGSVRAESDGPGRGARFVLRLPACPAPVTPTGQGR